MKASGVQTVCYVLTSDGTDSYADMNLISAWSVRQSNPQVRIVIFSDIGTKRALEAAQHPILTEVDEFRVVKTPVQSAGFTNRFIKTSLRRWIEGAFLFLDGDTLVRGDLSPVFEMNAALAGVANHSGSGHPSEMPETESAVFKEMGWDLPETYYVNGGVLFFSDHPDAYRFCELWHKRWLECSGKTGRHFDQVSLNRSLADSGSDFAWLDGRFNAQVHARPACAWGAAIWHIYLSGHHVSPKTVLDDCLNQMRRGQPVNRSMVAEVCQREHPWLISNPIDWFAVGGFHRHQELLDGTDWEHLWLADEHLKAIKQIVGIRRGFRNCVSRLFRNPKPANLPK
jgi:hypothetical protein